MDGQENVQTAIDSLRQELEGLKTKLHSKETALKMLLKRLIEAEQRMDDLLLGSIATFAMPEPPDGWLTCDGQEVSRQVYTALFTKIGTIFGKGDGKYTFNLPDLQGMFVRGWDGKRRFGSFQNDQMQGHTHKDAGHNHQGSTDGAGYHKHSGRSDQEGGHAHEGKMSENGEHSHYLNKQQDDKLHVTGFYDDYQGINRRKPKGRIIGSVGPDTYPGFNWGWDDKYSGSVSSIDSSGSHAHSLSIDSADSHQHSLEINPAGSHAHDFITAAAAAALGKPAALAHGEPRCGHETSPANVALLFCIKY